MEKDAFNLVIGQRFSMLNDGDVVFFDMVKYPVLIAIGIIASPLHKIEGFGEGLVAIMAEEATSDKVQIARFSADRQARTVRRCLSCKLSVCCHKRDKQRSGASIVSPK